MKKITQFDLETVRGVLFHMILFSMAWVLIGEYTYRFEDYAIGMGVILVVAVGLAIYSIRLYSLEDGLPSGGPADDDPIGIARQMRRDQLFAAIMLLEGLAAFATWTWLIREGFATWQISAFAIIAGLHFFPLAWVIKIPSYYGLGIWICAFGVWGYWMFTTGGMLDRYINTIVSYGCAFGGAAAGIFACCRANWRLKRSNKS